MGITEHQYYEAWCDARGCEHHIAEAYTRKDDFERYMRSRGWVVSTRGVFCPEHSKGYTIPKTEKETDVRK